MNKKQKAMTEKHMLMNEIIIHHMLGMQEGSLQNYTILNAPSGSSSEYMDKVKEQLNRFLATVSKFRIFGTSNEYSRQEWIRG